VKNKTCKPAITLGSLFDGIGGFPYTGSFYGITPLWASEILPQAVSVTTRHFPEMRNYGDITKLNGAELPPVDIITFGSPCQDLSTAGKRAGMVGARSNLFYEAIRIIDEMRKATNGEYPKYAVWENVPGANCCRAVCGRLRTEGYAPNSELRLNDFGAKRHFEAARKRHDNKLPQRRRRIFLVASFGAGRADEILFIEKGLRGYTAPGCKARQGVAPDAKRSAGVAMQSREQRFSEQSRRLDEGNGKAQCLNPWETQSSRVFVGDGVSPTLAGADGGGGRNPGGLVAAFLGGASDKARSIGYSEIVSPTLKSGASGLLPPCLCEPDFARTLTARGDGSPNIDSGPNIVALEIPAISEPYPINTQIATRHKALGEGTGFGVGEPGDPSYTITATAAPTIATEQILCLSDGQRDRKALENQCPTLTCMHEQPILCKPQTVYGICAEHSNSMLSANPHSGFYEAETVRTLDANCGSPVCNQGGMAIVEAVGVHQGQDGSVYIADTAYTLSTYAGASARNAPLIAHTSEVMAGVVTKGNGDCFLTPECHTSDLCVAYSVPTSPRTADIRSRPQAARQQSPDLCVAYSLQGNMIGRSDENGPRGSGINEEVCFTLTSADTPGVATAFNRYHNHFQEDNIVGTQTARQNQDETALVCRIREVSAVDCRNLSKSDELSGTLQAKTAQGYSLNYQNPVRTGYIVRRLTPTECERLQGFEDGWTAVGHDGKEISDSRRYQMLGNSVAIPCVMFVLGNIAEEMGGGS
jgi:DNA (cytosine-5)-methyltransferase 1